MINDVGENNLIYEGRGEHKMTCPFAISLSFFSRSIGQGSNSSTSLVLMASNDPVSIGRRAMNNIPTFIKFLRGSSHPPSSSSLFSPVFQLLGSNDHVGDKQKGNEIPTEGTADLLVCQH